MDTAILAFAMIGDDQSVSWVRQNTPLWKIHTFDRGHIDRTPPFNPKLVLIEQQYAKENLLQDIQQVYPSTCTAIINVSNPLSLLHLVKQPSLRGFFTPMDQRATINKGLLEIAAGGYWFPRAIADSLLDDFKKKSCGENQVRSRLTDKENKVINLVAHEIIGLLSP